MENNTLLGRNLRVKLGRDELKLPLRLFSSLHTNLLSPLI